MDVEHGSDDDKYVQCFNEKDADGDGRLSMSELIEAVKAAGLSVVTFEVRTFFKNDLADGVTLQNFKQLCAHLESQNVANTFKVAVSTRKNVKTLGGTSHASAEGTTHTVLKEEEVAFTKWINTNLSQDPDLAYVLPIQDTMLLHSMNDGVLLCKMINLSVPGTIDERAINKRQKKGGDMHVVKKLENHQLGLLSAQSIGCNVVNVNGHQLLEGSYLALGILWQVIRLGLFSKINIEQCPGLANLLEEGETLQDLLKLSPEEILLRWVNYHLARAGVGPIKNFTSDIKDSTAYTHLLKQIAPPERNVTTNPLNTNDMMKRAELMLQESAKLDCRAFLTPKNVVTGHHKLNVAFVANLFNNHPALEEKEVEVIKETREEKTYRNWMNSMGVNPQVNWLYTDLRSGVVILWLFNKIKPGLVDWKKVHTDFTKPRNVLVHQVENCNMAVELGRQMKFSLVGISGHNIVEGNKTLTLALVWQLMRAYTLSLLNKLNIPPDAVDESIVKFVNVKLKEAGKNSSINSFQDKAISTSMPIADLIDAIKPGSINYSMISNTSSAEGKYSNAKLVLSIARKAGAQIYALPEDIVEVNPKMVLTVFASLMVLDQCCEQQ